MKKLFTAVLALVLMFSASIGFISCSDGDDGSSGGESNSLSYNASKSDEEAGIWYYSRPFKNKYDSGEYCIKVETSDGSGCSVRYNLSKGGRDSEAYSDYFKDWAPNKTYTIRSMSGGGFIIKTGATLKKDVTYTYKDEADFKENDSGSSSTDNDSGSGSSSTGNDDDSDSSSTDNSNDSNSSSSGSDNDSGSSSTGNDSDSGSSSSGSGEDSGSSSTGNGTENTSGAESTKELIVGTWEGPLLVQKYSFMNYTLSFTFKADGTYTHVLTPNLTDVIIGPGTWSFANNVVTITPNDDPYDPMKARYDANAKTLSWTVADSGTTSITMTKKTSDSGSTGNGTPAAEPKVGDLGVDITTPVLPASVGENILAGKTYYGEEEDKITFDADGTGTYQMWENVDYTYWKIRYSYDNTNKILSLYPTEIKGPDGEYHDFAYYKNQYENQTITEAIKDFEKNVIHNSSPSGKLNYNKSTMVTLASKMLPNEPVTTSDSDEKIVRAYQKGLLKNCYAVYFGNVQNYYLKDYGNSFVAFADYEHSEPEAFRAFHMTSSAYSKDLKVRLGTDTQYSYRFYRLKLQINSASCDYVVKEITDNYIEVMFIPDSWHETDPYFTEENPKIPYSIVTPSDENISTYGNKVLKLTINGTNYELVYGGTKSLSEN